MQAKLKDFVYQMDNVPVKIKTMAHEGDLDVVHITVPVPDQDTSLDFLDCFRAFINADDYADDGDGLMSPDTTTPTHNHNHNDTCDTTFENISMYNTTLVDNEHHQSKDGTRNNSTMSEWDVISSGDSPEKSRTNVGTLKDLSDIKEEKSSSGVSSSSSSSFGLRSPRSTTSPATTFNREWGIPELKITDRFIAGIIQDVVDPSKFIVSDFIKLHLSFLQLCLVLMISVDPIKNTEQDEYKSRNKYCCMMRYYLIRYFRSRFILYRSDV